jgi:hypothetical protein
VPGTGLGLAIAKSVAEAHEGFLDIVDTTGWSTTFRVFLPLRTSVPAGRPASSPSPSPSPSSASAPASASASAPAPAAEAERLRLA